MPSDDIYSAQAKQDQVREAFFAGVGRAVTLWAAVEDQLFALFQYGLGSSMRRSAIVYNTVFGIEKHCEMVDKLLSISIDDSAYAHWCEIVSALKQLSAFRNRLAHDQAIKSVEFLVPPKRGSVSEDDKKLLTAEDVIAISWFLDAPHHKDQPFNKNSYARLEDILKHTSSVRALLASMRELRASLPSEPLDRLTKAPKPRFPRTSAPAKRKAPKSAKRQRQPPSSRA